MVAGHLQEKSGYWYCVITYKSNGRPKSKWMATGLKAKGNKKRAEEKLLLARILFDPAKPDQEMNLKSEPAQNVLKNMVLETPAIETDNDCNADKAGYWMDQLIADWLESVRNKVEKSTFAGYRHPVKNYLKPYFEDHPCLVKDLSEEYLYDYFELLYEKGLSYKTISNHRGIISGMIRHARQLKYLKYNPLELIDPPPKSQPVENYFSAAELSDLLATVRDTELEYPVMISILYGLRRSEVCGLKWDAVDFKNHIFTIRHTIEEVNNDYGHMEISGKDENKNKRIKSYPLLPQMEELLIRMKERQKDQGFYKSNGYVYLDEEKGVLVSPGYITSHFRSHLEKHGFKHIRFHDLRHSCASALLADRESAVGLKDIQSWLGHSDLKSTMRYAHIVEVKTKMHTAESINSLIFPQK